MDDDTAALRVAAVTAPSLDELQRFYRRSLEEACQYALRLTGGDGPAAEDLVHDAYVGLVRAWRDGRVDRLEVGWVVTAVRQRFLDRLRSTGRERHRLELVASDPAGSVAARAAGDPPADEAMACLAALAPRARAALVLRYVDDLPVADVARHLGASVRATESLLARARHQLRALVEEDRRG